MTVIHGVVVTGLLFGAHYICHQGAEGERVSLNPALAGLETLISSEGKRWKKEWPQKETKKGPRGAASHVRFKNLLTTF